MEKKNWFNKEIEEIEKELSTHKENGLKEEQIEKITYIINIYIKRKRSLRL